MCLLVVHVYLLACIVTRVQEWTQDVGSQEAMVPKTWDVLQQVITKVSKEQNTSVTLHGCTMDIKMRVFVCNSVEARAVGEYITAHKDQRPAPFVVLARQLSMAIAYNSAHLDPSQAAVADRLRKQAKTRAVKEIREAMRDAPPDISGPVLRGYVGALAPAAHIELLLLRRTVKVDLEGDEERAYIFFDAKNRSTAKDGPGTEPPSIPPHQQLRQTAQSAPAARGRKTPPVAQASRQPHQSPVNARVQALQAPGSPLSPGGRDGAAALLSLFNSVSAPDSPRGAGLPRHRPPYPAGDYFGQVPAQDVSPSEAENADAKQERPLSGRSHPKQSLAAQAAANANASAQGSATAASRSDSKTGSPFGRVPRPQVAIPDVEGYGGDVAGGLQDESQGGYDLNLVIASPKLRPCSDGRSSSLSIDLPPGYLLDAEARTPRSVVSPGGGWLGDDRSENQLYAAVNAGDMPAVQALLATPEGVKMVNEPISGNTRSGEESRALQRHHLIADSLIEYEVEDGVWWPAVVVSAMPVLDYVTIRYQRPGAQAPIGEAPLSRETKVDKKSTKLRVPSDSPQDFTALMCACMLDDESQACAMATMLLNHQADPRRADSEGFSALHWAAVKGHPSVITLLIDKKAAVDTQSTLSGETPLLVAARYGCLAAVDVLLSRGARSDTRTRQRMGLVELVTSGRSPGCKDVLLLVLRHQPALRTLLLHEHDGASVNSISEVLHQRYASDIVAFQDVRMGVLVGHAVEQVIKGHNRNSCCCLTYPPTQPAKNGVKEDRVGLVEILAAQHANEVDGSVQRLAILDLDGGRGDVLEEEVLKLARDCMSSPAARDKSVLYFSPDTSGTEASVGRNLALNMFRPSVGSRASHAVPGVTQGDGGGGKLSVSGTRDLLRQAIATKLVSCLRAYAPDVVIVSATYSAPPADDVLEPGARVPLTPADLERATRDIVKVAGMCSKSRLISFVFVHGSEDEAKGAEERKGAEEWCLAHVKAMVGC